MKIRSTLSRQGIGVRLRERDEFVFPSLIRQNVVSQTGQEKQAKVMNTEEKTELSMTTPPGNRAVSSRKNRL